MVAVRREGEQTFWSGAHCSSAARTLLLNVLLLLAVCFPVQLEGVATINSTVLG